MRQILVIAAGVLLAFIILWIVRDIPKIAKEVVNNANDTQAYDLMHSLSRQDVIKRCGQSEDDPLIIGKDLVSETYHGPYGDVVRIAYKDDKVYTLYSTTSRPGRFSDDLKALPCLASRK